MAIWIFSWVKYPFKSYAQFFYVVDLLLLNLFLGLHEFFWIQIFLGIYLLNLLSSFHSLNGFICKVEILNFVSNLLHFPSDTTFYVFAYHMIIFFSLKALFFLHLPFILQFIWNWFKHMLHDKRWDSLVLFPYDQLIEVAAFIEKASFSLWIVSTSCLKISCVMCGSEHCFVPLGRLFILVPLLQCLNYLMSDL